MTNEALMGCYLERLGFAQRPAVSRQALSELVIRHVQIVPFENLDNLLGVRSDLTTAAVLHKVAVRRRGGFCYELNEAFGALLTFLGFTVRRIEARVWTQPQGEFGPSFDHLALVITLPEGEFLTDVGFGDNNRTPMRLPGDTASDVSGRYTLTRASDDIWLLSRSDRPLYEMTLGAQSLAAFAPMYRFHRTSPDSIFAKGLICTRATAIGRITLSRDRLIIVDGANRTETVKPDCDLALEEYFGIAAEGETC
jgi:N-hydroxyarylamine O-acetyltransferase